MACRDDVTVDILSLLQYSVTQRNKIIISTNWQRQQYFNELQITMH